MIYKPVIDRIQDWPISKIALKKERILQETVSETILQLKKDYPTDQKIREQIQKTLYLERIRLKTEPWEVDPEDEAEFWSGIKKKILLSVTAENQEAAVIAQKNQDTLEAIVSRYAHEMIGNFSPRMFWFARQILGRLFARLFSHFGGFRELFRPKDVLKDKLIVSGSVETIRRLATKGTVVLVPTHFSNLDPTMIGYAMDYIGMPAFQYGAGLNLFNSKIFSLIMGNLGAYKLDRRKKSPIYLETLKQFSKTNILAGAHTIFFPGGTRSRNGAIENNLKLGLLGTVIDAQREHFENNPVDLAPKIFVVPLVLSYNFVLEASSLIDDYLKRTGKENYLVKESVPVPLKTIWNFFWETFSKSSDVHLSLGEPMDVFGNNIDDDGNSLDNNNNILQIEKYFHTNGVFKKDNQRESVYTQFLGDRIVESFHRNNVVKAAHIVPFVAFQLLKKKIGTSDIYTILRLPEEDREIEWEDFKSNVKIILDELYALNNKGKLKLSQSLITKELDEIIELGIHNIGIYHANLPLLKNKKGNITSEDINLLYYYHNRMDGYGLEKHIR
jgi:glycerol-3-phosphate O-acyltransferase